ncbi:MAG: LamG domain-containing protein [Actinobacteria bacterium]|nr:LamG domain-containing protein [Actinomycetota bacterium]
MSRYIGSTATVQPTQASAGGVYTLKDQLVYNAREQWPVARDPYFNYTTLLLQGDVPYTRGRSAMTLPLAYNSDASANNFLITPNGDVGPRPFSPYFGGNYSVYFDGTSGQYLNTPSNAAFAWVYLTGTNFCEVFTTAFGSVPTTATYRLLITTTQKLFYSDGTNSATSTASIALNTWTHVCVVREGTGTNQTKLYINGLQDGATTSSNNLTNSTGYIGRTWDGFIFTGYISNLRFLLPSRYRTSPTHPC